MSAPLHIFGEANRSGESQDDISRLSSPWSFDRDDIDETINARIFDLIRGIVRSELYRHRSASPEDVEDVCSDTVVALLGRIEELKARSEPGAEVIDFDAYAAVIARRACSAWSRRRYPAFYNLRTRLRYLLKKDSRFAHWQDARGEWLCGWAKDQKHSLQSNSVRLPEWETRDFDEMSPSQSPVALLEQIFDYAARPLYFNNLVRICADFWSVTDAPETMESTEIPCGAVEPMETSLDRRSWLQRLWKQLRELPDRHCAALLLNLRGIEGDCAASLLIFTGVATLQDLAVAVGMSEESFAGVWPRMPLSDIEIGEIMQISRQQVINLRKTARQRLRRGMDQVNLAPSSDRQRNNSGSSMYKGNH